MDDAVLSVAAAGRMTSIIRHTLSLVLVLLGLVAVYYLLRETGLTSIITDADRLQLWVSELGPTGPMIIMALMAIAIVINPIPSAPIALAAGAAYGHTWGTVYVVIGAAAGALAAFGIARWAGYELLHRMFGKKLYLGWFGSQNSLMLLVFISRLIPFLSFDLVSYGAGLTNIRVCRFAVATLAGLIPASFLLAHFGGELSSSSLEPALVILMLLGGVTIVPIVIRYLWVWYKNRKTSVGGKAGAIDETQGLNE